MVDIFNFFMEKLCWEVFIDYVHPCLDIDSRISCGFIANIKFPSDFNKKYFEMRTKYIIAKIPPHIHYGGSMINQGIDLTLMIKPKKFYVMEISEFHIKINMCGPDSLTVLYEESHFT